MMTVTKRRRKYVVVRLYRVKAIPVAAFKIRGRRKTLPALKLLVSNKRERDSRRVCVREIKRCHLSKGRKRKEHQGLTGRQTLAKFIQVEKLLNDFGVGRLFFWR